MEEKFDFDDILITADYFTTITHRSDIKLDMKKLPLLTAPMDTVVGLDNIELFLDLGIMVVLPRTVISYEYNKYILDNLNPLSRYKDVFISFGLGEIDKIIDGTIEILEKQNILIDVANGHMKSIMNTCEKLYKVRPDISVMVGNIANPYTIELYAQYPNVKWVRVGIGNGGGCLTTKNTSVGYPMASLISETYKVKFDAMISGKTMPKIIADGGMKSYSDVIKALFLGADMVMIGSIFNKALESSGTDYIYGFKINKELAKYCYKHKLPITKHFRGMSTKSAQKAMGKTIFTTSEGVVRYRKVEYTLAGWVENFTSYLRTAMSYTDNNTLERFIGNNKIIKISNRAYDRFNK